MSSPSARTLFLSTRFSMVSSAAPLSWRASDRRVFTSSDVASRAVSPASRFLPASRNSSSTSDRRGSGRCPPCGTTERGVLTAGGFERDPESSPQPRTAAWWLCGCPDRSSRRSQASGRLTALIVLPPRGYDEPEPLSCAISSNCPVSADGGHLRTGPLALAGISLVFFPGSKPAQADSASAACTAKWAHRSPLYIEPCTVKKRQEEAARKAKRKGLTVLKIAVT